MNLCWRCETEPARRDRPTCKRCDTLAAQAKRFNVKFEVLYDAKHNATHCDICRCTLETNYERKMDHSHEDGWFRGVLCNKCNATLGMIEKSNVPITDFFDYIDHHKTKRYPDYEIPSSKMKKSGEHGNSGKTRGNGI